MIIKAVRVPARGVAEAKLLAHLGHGDENETIEIVQGTEADVRDAFRDARSRGRAYGIRHWIIAPKEKCSRTDALEIVARMGREFGFNPASAIIYEHGKQRVPLMVFDRHWHVLVPEQDAIAGRSLSSSFSFLRHEKIARISEYELGHQLTPGAHNAAVSAALRRDGRSDVADVLDRIVSAVTRRPREAYSHAAHQRAKRQGDDLPALQRRVAQAWSVTRGRTDFEELLAQSGMTVRLGTRRATYIVETAAGSLIGSITKLVKARIGEVRIRMENCDVSKPAAEDRIDHGPADPGRNPSASSDVETGEPTGHGRARSGREERCGNDGGDPGVDLGSGAADPRQPAADDVAPDATHCGEIGEGGDEGLAALTDLQLNAGLHRYTRELHFLLAAANREAQTNSERTAAELEFIATEARSAVAAVSSLIPEPAHLASRRAEVVAAKILADKAQDQAREVREAYHARLPWRWEPWWRRIWKATAARIGRTELARLETANQHAALRAEAAANRHINAQVTLSRLEAENNKQRATEIRRRQKAAEAAREVLLGVEAARHLWQLLPGLSDMGAEGLLRLGSDMARRRSRDSATHVEPSVSGL